MSEQTPEVTDITTLPVTEESAPVEKKFFDTKKKVALIGAATAAAVLAIYVKVKNNSNSTEEDVLWTEGETVAPQTSTNDTPAS